MNKILIVLLIVSSSLVAQKSDYNTKKGFVAEGYDVVSYFNNKAEKGDKKFTTTYDGVQFKFSSKENLETFKKSPKKYEKCMAPYTPPIKATKEATSTKSPFIMPLTKPKIKSAAIIISKIFIKIVLVNLHLFFKI